MHPASSLYWSLLFLSYGIVNSWNAQPSRSQPTIEVKPAIPGGVTIAANESAGQVLETHHTTCRITTEELVATAQATATRVLTGLCNSREMDDRFKALEAQISDLLDVLKSMLTDLDGKISNPNNIQRVKTLGVQNSPGDDLNACVGHQCSSEVGRSPQELILNTEDKKNTKSRELEGIPGQPDAEGPRAEEISRFNNTIHMEPFPDATLKNTATSPLRVFTYYWRICGISAKINSGDPRRSLRSPSFYVTPTGYRMYLLVFPRQNYENLYVHVGITAGVNDANLAWPFPLKHRIQLLDQVKPTNSGKKRPLATPLDLSSRIWNPALLCSDSVWRRPVGRDSAECVGLGYPHDVLRTRNYIHEDSIVIRLTVYLG